MTMESLMVMNSVVAQTQWIVDSDDDGISDGDELTGGTNPNDSDSDDDGLTDDVDDAPLDPDVDNDDVLDGEDPDNTTDECRW